MEGGEKRWREREMTGGRREGGRVETREMRERDKMAERRRMEMGAKEEREC